MTYDEFISSVEQGDPPDDLPETLISLWWEKKGEWRKAHSIAEKIDTNQGSAVHAYLHRQEGVLWNADYWYQKAGRRRPVVSPEREWHDLVVEMLA